MSGEWEPGDVAMVPFPGREVRCFRTEQGWLRADLSDGGHPVQKFMDPRPLVVIDPEDAEQMRALGNAWDDLADKHVEVTDEPMTLSALRMQFALREFANPTPRIEEPTGLGAVVEDEDGRLWVRSPLDDYPWNTAHRAATGIITAPWSEVNAVHVLSEGVPS